MDYLYLHSGFFDLLQLKMKSIVKLLLSILFLVATITNYGNIQIKKNKAQKEYLKNLHIIQDCIYKGKKVPGEVFDSAIFFLETTTNIKSNYSYGQEVFAIPNEQNIKDWKNWYKRNKTLLYWDQNDQRAKVKYNYL